MEVTPSRKTAITRKVLTGRQSSHGAGTASEYTKKSLPFDEYYLKCRTLHTICELLETNPQDAKTSRQLITYCIDNLHDVQFQASLNKVPFSFLNDKLRLERLIP